MSLGACPNIARRHQDWGRHEHSRCDATSSPRSDWFETGDGRHMATRGRRRAWHGRRQHDGRRRLAGSRHAPAELVQAGDVQLPGMRVLLEERRPALLDVDGQLHAVHRLWAIAERARDHARRRLLNDGALRRTTRTDRPTRWRAWCRYGRRRVGSRRPTMDRAWPRQERSWTRACNKDTYPSFLWTEQAHCPSRKQQPLQREFEQTELMRRNLHRGQYPSRVSDDASTEDGRGDDDVGGVGRTAARTAESLGVRAGVCRAADTSMTCRPCRCRNSTASRTSRSDDTSLDIGPATWSAEPVPLPPNPGRDRCRRCAPRRTTPRAVRTKYRRCPCRLRTDQPGRCVPPYDWRGPCRRQLDRIADLSCRTGPATGLL